MFASSKSGAVAEPTDNKFNYVTMLLHGNGTNGAQNNTFLDSSTNNFTITRNGNTTQGTFSPYGSNWSNYFNGSSAVVNRSNNTALAMGTGDFTIEFWMNAPSTSSVIVLYDSRLTTSSSTGGINIYHQSGTLYLYGGATTNVLLVSASITYNQWNHIAFVKSGSGTGNVKMYVNGVLSSTYGSADTSNYSLGYMALGAFYNPSPDYFYTGYLSNFRIVKGTAVYTGAFTPPTTPLTAITNTSLLTCADNRFIDDSTNNFALTLVGSPSVQRFSPFSPTTAYSTSVIGGSGYFDGTGDYLSLPSNSAFAFGTGDFTVDGWVYSTSTGSASKTIFNTGGSGNNFSVYLTSTNQLNYVVELVTATGGGTVPTNTWTHIACSRSSGTIRLFINGAQVYSGSETSSISQSAPNVSSSTYPFFGYMSNIRIVKGTAVYTSAFTPPTAPVTAITNTVLLLDFTNAGILDNAMMNDLETVGNAQISTSVKKYGTGSISFDATADRLVASSSPNIAFGTGDFTVEFWLNSNNVSSANQRGVIQTSDTSGGLKTGYTTGISIYQGGNASGGSLSGGITANVAGTFLGSSSAVITTGTWYHIALVRSSGTSKIYVNGTSVGSATTTGNCSGQNICVGGSYDTSYLYDGYIDDLRITKGFARYTSDFTAPTAAFADKG
jgi:hypothetical protein